MNMRTLILSAVDEISINTLKSYYIVRDLPKLNYYIVKSQRRIQLTINTYLSIFPLNNVDLIFNKITIFPLEITKFVMNQLVKTLINN